MTSNDDNVLQVLARALAPYLRQELGLGPSEPAGEGAWSPDYDEQTCRQFVSPLHIGDTVLLRMRTFFGELATTGSVSAPDLVRRLDLKGATSIPANLTNPLKKRVARFGFPRPPWDEYVTADDRTLWRDRDGIAQRMLSAIGDEIVARGVSSFQAGPRSRPGLKRLGPGSYESHDEHPFRVQSVSRPRGPRGGEADVWIVIPPGSTLRNDGTYMGEIVCEHLSEAIHRVQEAGGATDVA